MSVQRPYGQWDSPVEADSYTQTSVQLSQVRVDEADTGLKEIPATRGATPFCVRIQWDRFLKFFL